MLNLQSTFFKKMFKNNILVVQENLLIKMHNILNNNYGRIIIG